MSHELARETLNTAGDSQASIPVFVATRILREIYNGLASLGLSCKLKHSTLMVRGNFPPFF